MSETPKGFRFLSAISNTSVIAEGRGIKVRQYLKRDFGGLHWRKMKGVARVETDDGWIGYAEVHWFESHGVGKVLWKIKREIG